MATKVDQASSVEPLVGRTSVMTSPPIASTSGPKVSMFAKKSGFVIPKNKLSGSLVPAFRATGKTENRDTKEEGSKQVKRKTKWGNDLTQDADVQKGRALAYQTRVEQIAQQLKSEVLEMVDEKQSESQTEEPESSRPQRHDQLQKLEGLELEKREAIGEILKLDPSYKVPSDYKPLLKEATIPIPLTRFPGYNFIGVILGSGSDTRKRLEEETGAKIRIHGTKAGTGEKVEVTSSDGSEVQSPYEELFVHVSANTFEKVDAAVALIELLVAPLSGNSAVASTTPSTVTGDTVALSDPGQKDTATAASFMMPIGAVNQSSVQPMLAPSQPGSVQVQFQPYRGPWFPPGPTQTAILQPSGFMTSPNSAPIANNSVQFPPSPVNNLNTGPFFSGQPQQPTSTGFGTIPRNQSPFSPRPQQPMQGLQRSYTPDMRPPTQAFQTNHLMPNQQNPNLYPSMPPQTNPGASHQNSVNQPMGRALGGGQMVFPVSQPLPATVMGSLPGRPQTAGGWSGSPMAQPSTPSQPPHLMVNNTSSGLAFASRPPHSGPLLMAGPIPAAQTSPMSPMSPAVPRGPGPVPPVTTPRPQRPNSGDFTFQPIRPQLPASQTSPGPINQSMVPQNALHMPTRPSSAQPPPPPLAPSFRPAMNNSVMVPLPIPSPGSGISPRSVYPSPIQPAPRLPPFPNSNHVLLRSPPVPPRPVNPLQLQQNQFTPPTRPGSMFVPNQQFGNNLTFLSSKQGFSPGGNQVYDPFSPTSISSSAHKQGDDSAKKQENNPE